MTLLTSLQGKGTKSKHTIIMAGNVCTPEMVQELIHGGVDIVKIALTRICLHNKIKNCWDTYSCLL